MNEEPSVTPPIMNEEPVVTPSASTHPRVATEIHNLYEQLAQLQAQLKELQHQSHSPPSLPEPKLAMPERFNGDWTRLSNFLMSLENVFRLQPRRYASNEIQVRFAGTLLEGKALTWFRLRMAESDGVNLLGDFGRFTEALVATFGNPARKQIAQDKLPKLRQKRSALEYVNDFTETAEDTGYNEETLMHYFRKGLKEDVGRAILINDRDFSSFRQMAEYAIRVDNFLHIQRSVTIIPPYRSGPTPMDLGTIQTPPDSERRRRRENNLCFACGESGHYQRDCPGSPRLNRVMGNDVARPCTRGMDRA